jgi:hypothetical protein
MMLAKRQHFVGQAGSLRAGCQPALVRQLHTSDGGILSTPLEKFANVSNNRLLTRAARIGAATVRERLLLNTGSYLRSGVLSEAQ